MSSLIEDDSNQKNISEEIVDNANKNKNEVKEENVNEEPVVGENNNAPANPPQEQPPINPDVEKTESQIELLLKNIKERLKQEEDDLSLDDGIANSTETQDFDNLTRALDRVLDILSSNDERRKFEREAMFELGRQAFNYILHNLGVKNQSGTVNRRKDIAKKLMAISESGVDKYSKQDTSDKNPRVKAQNFMKNEDAVNNNSSLKQFKKQNSTQDTVNSTPVFEAHINKKTKNPFKQKAFVGIRFTGYDNERRVPVRREMRIGFKGKRKISGLGQLVDEYETNAGATVSTNVSDEKIGEIIKAVGDKSQNNYNIFRHNSNHFVKDVASQAGFGAISGMFDATFTGKVLKNINDFNASVPEEEIFHPKEDTIRVKTIFNEQRQELFRRLVDEDNPDLEDVDPTILETILTSRIDGEKKGNNNKSLWSLNLNLHNDKTRLGQGFLDVLSKGENFGEKSIAESIKILISAVSARKKNSSKEDAFIRYIDSYMGARMDFSTPQLARHLSVAMMMAVYQATKDKKNNEAQEEFKTLRDELVNYDISLDDNKEPKNTQFKDGSAALLLIQLRSQLEEAFDPAGRTQFDEIVKEEDVVLPLDAAPKVPEDVKQDENEKPQENNSKENESSEQEKQARYILNGNKIYSPEMTGDFIIAALTMKVENETPDSIIRLKMNIDKTPLLVQKTNIETQLKTHAVDALAKERDTLVNANKNLEEKQKNLKQNETLSVDEQKSLDDNNERIALLEISINSDNGYVELLNRQKSVDNQLEQLDERLKKVDTEYNKYRETVKYEDNLYLLTRVQKMQAMTYMPALSSEFERIGAKLEGEDIPKTYINLDEIRLDIEKKGISNGVKDIYYAIRSFLRFFNTARGKEKDDYLYKGLSEGYLDIREAVTVFMNNPLSKTSAYKDIVDRILTIIDNQEFIDAYNTAVTRLKPEEPKKEEIKEDNENKEESKDNSNDESNDNDNV